MWKTGKLTGKLGCRWKWSKSRQDTVPQVPSLSHVIKTVMLSLLWPGISIEIKFQLYWLFHTSAWWFYFSKWLHHIDHDSGLSLTTCFPSILCLWLLCFHGYFWNTTTVTDEFGKFDFDGADELCNSTHMNELTGSRGFYISTLCPIFLFWYFFYRKHLSLFCLFFLLMFMDGLQLDFLFIWRRHI